MTAYSPNDFTPGWSLCYVAAMTAGTIAGVAAWLMLAYSIH